MIINRSIHLRTSIKPGDVEAIISLHGTIYAQEYGFDTTFEHYVATPLRQFASSHTLREKLWVVEQGGSIKGCIAVIKSDEATAQLRWFLLHPQLRRKGIGKKLIHEAVLFVQQQGYVSVFLWTVNLLERANRLYRTMGFQLTEEKTHMLWGKELTEQKYELVLEH
ncbi:MAG: N-acetyltransferase [Thermoplasmatales archaeon]|jgi:N-acetylglutamate synthase-like GNAT family acetyltransferase|nr:N-acetyltransferase [Thermoplasmatales archaeon]